MKAVVSVTTAPGGPEVLKLEEVEEPTIAENEVLIKVYAFSVNRSDTIERIGASPYLGLACSGTIEKVGAAVNLWKIGDQICALLSGGGYAEKVAVPVGQLLSIPLGISLKDAACFPEVASTVWYTVFMSCKLKVGETLLVHDGSSGIGTFAIQIAKYHGAKVFVTTAKLAFCKLLGADVGINYKSEDFVARVKEETGGKGVDVILDNFGAPYLQRNLDRLNIDRRLFIIGFMGETNTEVDLKTMFAKRIAVLAGGLRSRAPEDKQYVVSEVESCVWPAIMYGRVRPVVHKEFPLSEVTQAHQLMESNKHIGKILLLP